VGARGELPAPEPTERRQRDAGGRRLLAKQLPQAPPNDAGAARPRPVAVVAGRVGPVERAELLQQPRNRRRALGHRQSASGPISPVRIRTTCSTGATQIFPSPILPVRAALVIASTMPSTRSSSASTSTLTLGTKSTWYSAPR